MLNVFHFSTAGGHAVNEDAFEVQRHPVDADCWLCCLADGQGGRAGGGQAAYFACPVVMEGAFHAAPDKLANSKAWTTILRAADAMVAVDREAGCTTLVGFTITGDTLHGASSGDSAVLVVSKDTRPAIVTARQFKNPPVGSGEALFVPFEVNLVRPWSVLAMSDGVWKYAGWERVMTLATSLRGQSLVDGIANLARLPGSGEFQDDLTLVVFEEDG